MAAELALDRANVALLAISDDPDLGFEFTQLYNDDYAKLNGAGHPAALGNDIWITLAASWDTLGPMIAHVMQTGDANWTLALPHLMERDGHREDAYFSVSHAPVEEDGRISVCWLSAARSLRR